MSSLLHLLQNTGYFLALDVRSTGANVGTNMWEFLFKRLSSAVAAASQPLFVCVVCTMARRLTCPDPFNVDQMTH